MSPKGTLYLIPCPIGEGAPEKELPLANTAVIAGLDYFIVENLRSARRFLSGLGMGKPIQELEFAELNEHTATREIEEIAAPLLRGISAGLISEAGLPAVADPGSELVAWSHRNGVKVVPLPGPSSILMALMSSGLNGQSFAFNGYLPVKNPDRSRTIRHFEKRAQTERQSQIFIEAPYRNVKLFEELIITCNPATMLTVACNISSPGEFILTQPVSEWKRRAVPDINKKPAIFIIL